LAVPPFVRVHSWLALCLLHAVASMLVWWGGEGVASSLTWHADSWLQRPWTLWTSAWVHLHTPHLVGNQLALGALVALAWWVRPTWQASLAWFLAWPSGTLMLLLWPQIGYFVGLSGLIHAALVVVAVGLTGRTVTPSVLRLWGVALWAGLMVKLVIEQAWRQPVAWDEGANLSVVLAAHLSGVVAGLGWYLVLRWLARPAVLPGSH
jgi:membrane associated rhomboid family serine protease